MGTAADALSKKIVGELTRDHARVHGYRASEAISSASQRAASTLAQRAPSGACCYARSSPRLARRFSTAAPPSRKEDRDRGRALRRRLRLRGVARRWLGRRRRYVIPGGGGLSSVGGVRLQLARRWPHARRPLVELASRWRARASSSSTGIPTAALTDGRGPPRIPRRTQMAPRGCELDHAGDVTPRADQGGARGSGRAAAPRARSADAVSPPRKFRWRSSASGRPSSKSSRREARRDRRAPRAAAARPASRRAGEDCGRRARSGRSGAAASSVSAINSARRSRPSCARRRRAHRPPRDGGSQPDDGIPTSCSTCAMYSNPDRMRTPRSTTARVRRVADRLRRHLALTARSGAERGGGAPPAPSPSASQRSIVANVIMDAGSAVRRTRLDIDEQQRRGDGARCGDRTRQRVAAEMRRAQRRTARPCGGVSARPPGTPASCSTACGGGGGARGEVCARERDARAAAASKAEAAELANASPPPRMPT